MSEEIRRDGRGIGASRDAGYAREGEGWFSRACGLRYVESEVHSDAFREYMEIKKGHKMVCPTMYK